MRIVLVTGGARSGKSRYAEERARRLGGDEVTYVATATATAGDEDMRMRIARHRQERPGVWVTIEAPTSVGDAIRTAQTPVVLLDCITMLGANAAGGAPPGREAVLSAILAEVEEIVEAAGERAGTLIAVTNEVGSGIHPASALGRWFQDGLGRANQRLASAADEVVLMVSGLPMIVKAGTATR